MPLNVRVELSRAVELHRTGRLDEAIALYRRLAKARPGTFAIQRLLVLALLQAGRVKDALSVARRARDEHPADAHAQLVMGMALRASGEGEKALAAFNMAVTLDPNLLEADYLAANALGALGRLDEAISRYDRVIARDPRSAEARSGRAAALLMRGRVAEALGDLDSLTAMQPWEATHFISKADALARLDRYDAAAEAAAEAVRLAPESSQAHRRHAQALLGLGRLADARAALQEAARLAPDDAALSEHLLSLLRLSGDFPAMLRESERALSVHPGSALFLTQRAEARRALQDPEGALADARAALDAEADFAPAAVTLARTHADLGQAEMVGPALEQALSRDPVAPDALYLAACEDLAQGRWREGWAGYEHRARAVPAPFTAPDLPRWNGKDAPETLVVVGEQGAGDQIFFARLLRLLADRGQRTVFVTRPELIPLLQVVDARVEMAHDLAQVVREQPQARWVPLGSLPHLLCPDPAEWPVGPYLRPVPERVAQWSGLRVAGKLMVGVSRRGAAVTAMPGEGADGAIPPAALQPLMSVEGLELVDLDQGAGIAVAEGAQLHGAGVQGRGGAYLDMVGILQHLDAVVTADSDLAHLAGARGISTWLAVRAIPDWRWGRTGRSTPFYPNVQVIRQERAGDWAGVFETIAAELRGRAPTAG